MKKYWIIGTGEEIEYSKIGDSHLKNIIKWIEKRAEIGELEVFGNGWDPDSFDCCEIFGEEVFDKYDYEGLQKELKKREGG